MQRLNALRGLLTDGQISTQEELVRELERRLQFATVDPHGKAIPALGEIRGTAPSRGETTIGFRRPGP